MSYKCPKHGFIGEAAEPLHISGIPGETDSVFRYCLLCFNEFLSHHCHQVVEVSEGDLPVKNVGGKNG